jgi:hypothetical protein
MTMVGRGCAARGAVSSRQLHPLAAADDRQEKTRPFVVSVAGKRFGELA